MRPTQALVQRNAAGGRLRKQSDQTQSPAPAMSSRKSILTKGREAADMQYRARRPWTVAVY